MGKLTGLGWCWEGKKDISFATAQQSPFCVQRQAQLCIFEGQNRMWSLIALKRKVGWYEHIVYWLIVALFFTNKARRDRYKRNNWELLIFPKWVSLPGGINFVIYADDKKRSGYLNKYSQIHMGIYHSLKLASHCPCSCSLLQFGWCCLII